MPVNEQDWIGLIDGIRNDVADVSLVAPLRAQSESRGWSLPFLGLASDDERYWIKMTSNRQSSRTPVTEQVISGCGRLIRAPVCDVALIQIPEDFDDHELRNGTILKSGLAHGSRDIRRALFTKKCDNQHRQKDDNRHRHAMYFALFQWCWGEDMQWLYDTNDDMTTWSHDHGYFLPGSPDWTIDSLRNGLDTPRPVPNTPNGLNPESLEKAADSLDQLTRSQIVEVLKRVPLSWGVSDVELEFLGYFLEYRAVPTSDRLRQLAATLPV